MKLVLALQRTNAVAKILLNADQAPSTFRALLTLLPADGSLIHSRRSGQEVFAVLPPTSFPDENLMTAVKPGDVVIAGFPPYYRDAPPGPIVEPGKGYTHLGIVYGPDSRFATPEGYPPVCVVGKVAEGMDTLVAACGIIRKMGRERYSLRREG